MFKKFAWSTGRFTAVAAVASLLFLLPAPRVRAASDPFFFQTQVSLGNNWFYSPDFGYYNTSFYTGGSTVLYKAGFGFLYSFGDDGNSGAYFYDFGGKGFLYTNAAVFDYPGSVYFYSFSLGAWVFYFEDTDDANLRAFFDFSGNVVFTPAD